METVEQAGDSGVASGALLLEVRIVLADGTMSPGAVEKYRRSGSVGMKAPAGGMAYLEVGGVVVAEGKMRIRGGRAQFAVARAYESAGEERR